MKSSPPNVLRGLYVITDATLISPQHFTSTIEQTLRGGARIIQYRDKSSDHNRRLQQALSLKKICAQYRALLIINDDIELANKIDADGVHIGSHDAALADARKQLGDKIIGVSCYDQFELAVTAEKNGADYIAFGSFFSSSTKPDAARADTSLIVRAKQKLKTPVCAIGGITIKNAPALVTAGADMIAVITDLFTTENIESRSNQFMRLF